MTTETLFIETYVEGEDTVDNETFFNDLVSGLTAATNQLREQNACALLRETLQWVGRSPRDAEEKATLDSLKERVESVLAA